MDILEIVAKLDDLGTKALLIAALIFMFFYFKKQLEAKDALIADEKESFKKDLKAKDDLIKEDKNDFNKSLKSKDDLIVDLMKKNQEIISKLTEKTTEVIAHNTNAVLSLEKTIDNIVPKPQLNIKN